VRECAHCRFVCKRDDGAVGSGFQHRVDALGRCARNDAQVRMLTLHARHMLGIATARRMPRITELPRAPNRSRGAAADPDLGFARGMRLGRRIVDRPVLALEVLVAAPEGSHQANGLIRTSPASLELDAEEVELVLVPAQPDAECDAFAGDLLQRRHLLREVDGMVQRHEHDRCPESDPLRETRDPAQRDERRVHTAVRVDSLGPDDDVLGRPNGMEAELLRDLGNATDLRGRRALAVIGEDDAEVHDPRLTTARVARLATIDADGKPHLVPIVFIIDGDTVYTAVDRKRKRSKTLQRIENARARPDVTILVDHYEDDWNRLWWVRLRGRARVLDEGEERNHGLALLAEKYAQYRSEPPDGPVLAVDVTDVREWKA
jgi:PPOX class probable F420-dependent enzyme